MKEDFLEKSKKNKEQAKAMEARYKKECVGYARIREIIIKNKIEAGEENRVVSRLDAWEYARRNADGVVNDPIALQVLEDVVIKLIFLFYYFFYYFYYNTACYIVCFYLLFDYHIKAFARA